MYLRLWYSALSMTVHLCTCKTSIYSIRRATQIDFQRRTNVAYKNHGTYQIAAFHQFNNVAV